MPIAETPRIETWNSLKYLPTKRCVQTFNAICTDSSARMNYNSEIFFHDFTADDDDQINVEQSRYYGKRKKNWIRIDGL